MTLKEMISGSLATGVLALGLTMSAPAQSGNTFKARLAPAPRLVMTDLQPGQASRNVGPEVIVGSIGSASAVLNGRKLTVTGSFEKLTSKPTEAHLFVGPMTGVRDQGKPAFDLAISKTQSVPAPPAEPARGGRGGQQGQQAQQPQEARLWYSGAINGTVELTSGQVDALKKGRLYIQVHSEAMPSGQLAGWLLK